MYFYSLIENCQLRIAAPKFEFGCGFYFCVIGALKYIIGYFIYRLILVLFIIHALLLCNKDNVFFNSSLKPITKNFPTTNKKLPNY